MHRLSTHYPKKKLLWPVIPLSRWAFSPGQQYTQRWPLQYNKLEFKQTLGAHDSQSFSREIAAHFLAMPGGIGASGIQDYKANLLSNWLLPARYLDRLIHSADLPLDQFLNGNYKRAYAEKATP